MKKSKLSKLAALGLAGLLALTGCSTGSKTPAEQPSTNPDGAAEKTKFVIGINQLTEHPALDDARQGFIDGLKELGVEAEIVYQNAQGEIPNTLTIAQKFASDKVDLIYAIATPAAQSTKQATSDIPVLFSAVTDPVEAGIVDDWDNVGGNVTGTSDKAPVDIQVKMFREIDPTIETIGILYNTSEANSEVQIAVFKELAEAEGLKVETVGISNINEVPQGMDTLLNKADAVYGLSDNMVVSAIEVVNKKLIDSNTISVGTEESQVGGGILITNSLSYYELGKQTAQMAKEILVDGTDVSNMPVGTAKNTTTIVNEATWKALGLDENMQLYKDAVKVGN